MEEAFLLLFHPHHGTDGLLSAPTSAVQVCFLVPGFLVPAFVHGHLKSHYFSSIYGGEGKP